MSVTASGGETPLGESRAAQPGLESLKGGLVVLAAGGTGGHLFPAQALAETLSAAGCRIVLVTDHRGRDFAHSFPEAEIRMVDAATFAGRGWLGKASAGFSIVSGIAQAWALLGRLKPVAVVGFGGYPSLPAMAGALARGIPTCIHEQNTVLGRVNRMLSGRVGFVACGFDTLLGRGRGARVEVTGNPVRRAVAALRSEPYRAPADGEPIRLLIFGGSQGASVMGEVVPGALAGLPEAMRTRLVVTQQTRSEDEARIAAAYDEAGIKATLSPFFKDMDRRLAEAHLVIARAGASTVTELAVAGRPSLLVPLPGAMDDHQTHNAAFLSEPGGAWRVPQTAFTSEALRDRLESLLADPEALTEAARIAHGLGRPDATVRLAGLIAGLTGRAPAQDVIGVGARPAA